MRTTVTIEDDVAALIDAERHRTGETFREALNRLLRRAVHRADTVEGISALPTLAGRPRIDVTDISAVTSRLDEERTWERRAL